MSFLNGFLDNVASGALSPKGNLGDFAHAARMFVDDNQRLAPKVKFLYHVTFNINPKSSAVIPQLAQKHMNEIGMLVKSAQLPAFNIQTDVINQYNRKKVVQKRIDYQPVSITFHDDNYGVTTALWEAYYRYYYRDGNYAKVNPAGAPDPTIPEYATNKPSFSEQYASGTLFSEKQYRYGFDNDSAEPFFTSIQISQMSRKRYTTMTLINPIISQWQHDTMDYSASDPVSNSMTIEYETVHYSRGSMKNGPKGFGDEHYDKTPSPNSLGGGGASSLLGVGGVLAGGFGVIDDITGGKADFGTVLRAANTIKNAGNLDASGIKGELIGKSLNALGKASGVDVSGVAGLAFPTGGSGDFKTAALAAGVVGVGKLINSANPGGGTTSKTSSSSSSSASGPRGGTGLGRQDIGT